MTWWLVGVRGFTLPLPDMTITEGPNAGHESGGH